MASGHLLTVSHNVMQCIIGPCYIKNFWFTEDVMYVAYFYNSCFIGISHLVLHVILYETHKWKSAGVRLGDFEGLLHRSAYWLSVSAWNCEKRG
jgi:hypothetical protein